MMATASTGEHPAWLMALSPNPGLASVDAGGEGRFGAENSLLLLSRPDGEAIEDRERPEMPPPAIKARRGRPNSTGKSTGVSPNKERSHPTHDGSCAECGVRKTPLWRAVGGKILCNACGLRRMRANKVGGPRRTKKKKKRVGPKGEAKPADTFARPAIPRKKLLVPGGLPGGKHANRSAPGGKRLSDSPEVGPFDEDDENRRRGKRKRKASGKLQRQHETDMILKAQRSGTYRSADFARSDSEEESSEDSEDSGAGVVVATIAERGGAGVRGEVANEYDSVREASAILADMEGLQDGDSDAEDLSDEEFDLIWKLHRVYGPHKESLLKKVARTKESSTLTMAIVLRATMNLHKSGAISDSQKLWLISKLSSDDPNPYLASLPAATTDYRELEDLLLDLVPKQEKQPALVEKSPEEPAKAPELQSPTPVPTPTLANFGEALPTLLGRILKGGEQTALQGKLPLPTLHPPAAAAPALAHGPLGQVSGGPAVPTVSTVGTENFTADFLNRLTKHVRTPDLSLQRVTFYE